MYLKQTTLIFKIGTLEVYAVTEITAATPLLEPTKGAQSTASERIYWVDMANPKSFGPFDTIKEAMLAYNSYLTALTAPPPSLPVVRDPSDPIHVDFVTKSRL